MKGDGERPLFSGLLLLLISKLFCSARGFSTRLGRFVLSGVEHRLLTE